MQEKGTSEIYVYIFVKDTKEENQVEHVYSSDNLMNKVGKNIPANRTIHGLVLNTSALWMRAAHFAQKFG